MREFEKEVKDLLPVVSRLRAAAIRVVFANVWSSFFAMERLLRLRFVTFLTVSFFARDDPFT